MGAQTNCPVALTIAGSDSSAGAGAQADLKTFSSLGVYGLTAITCVVAETPGKVARIGTLDVALVREQIEILFAGFPIAAAKTGMLHSAEIVGAVAELFRTLREQGRAIPLIVDPVMIATSGDPLLQPDAVELYERELFPLATVITPNLDEAQALCGWKIVDVAGMKKAGLALADRYGVPVLVKGGHLGGDEAIDLLCFETNALEFSSPFVRGVGTHGTGCTYSAAIAAELALGTTPLAEAIGRAKKFVTAAIAQHLVWNSPAGDSVHALNHSPPPGA